MKIIARIHSDSESRTWSGIPSQSGIVNALKSVIVFELL